MTQPGPVPLANAGPARRGDRVWLVAAAVAAVLAAAQLLGALAGLAFGPRGMVTVQGFGGALAAWWFAKGSWLRTARGRPREGTEAPWDEPALTSGRARGYVWLAAGCVAASAVAVSIQVVDSIG